MNMRELIVKLQDEEAELKTDGYMAYDFEVVGYLEVQEGVSMDLKSVFIDGSTLHLDFRLKGEE